MNKRLPGHDRTRLESRLGLRLERAGRPGRWPLSEARLGFLPPIRSKPQAVSGGFIGFTVFQTRLTRREPIEVTATST